MRAFAGDDVTAAVPHPEDDRWLVDRESTVTHHQVHDPARAQAGAASRWILAAIFDWSLTGRKCSAGASSGSRDRSVMVIRNAVSTVIPWSGREIGRAHV